VIARRGNEEIYYESTGRGVPVLLVMGLGMSAAGWWRTVPVLSERLSVLTFDNRGVGRSAHPPGPYSLQQMADDAVAVLDAAQVKRAHVYGISMGGMIAQEIALRHPDRLRALVLAATSPGGPHAAGPDEATIDFLRRRPSMPREEGVWASVPYTYSTRTRERHAPRIGEDIALRLSVEVDPAGYEAQLAAAWEHDAIGRLSQIAAPTLVMHGTEDRMVPVANARLLADAIPGARLRLLEGAGHLFTTDDLEADHEVLQFLVAMARAGQRAGARGTPRSDAAREARA
jgi:3-oxoadipate enol-lactonase